MPNKWKLHVNGKNLVVNYSDQLRSTLGSIEISKTDTTSVSPKNDKEEMIPPEPEADTTEMTLNTDLDLDLEFTSKIILERQS